MANVLGRLVVLLGLDAAEYTRGLTKAEAQAQKFAANTRSAILEVGKVLGSLEIARQVYESTKAIIAEAAALNDLADATGSTVESLSRLNNQVKIAGGDLQEMQGALLKLSQGMGGTDKASQRVQETLKLLGVSTKDPVEALQQVALKLNEYQDGVNKVALAQALFGKQGAAFLATLKDIAELQDVGATVTAKQAAEAENLEKAWRRLSVEAEGFKNVILSGLVPALSDLLFQFTEGTRIAGGFFQAMSLFGTLQSSRNLADLTTEIKGVEKALADAEAKAKRNKDFFGLETGADAIANFRKQLQYLQTLQARAQTRDPALQAAENRGFVPPKPTAPQPPAGASATSKALKEQTSDAERYLLSLRKQHEATIELSEVQKAELVLYELKRKALSGLTPAIESQIRAFAAALDADKEADRVAKELAKSQADAAKAKEQYAEGSRKAVEAAEREAAGIRQGNETIREQIIELRGGKEALDAYQAAKREAAAAAEEFRAGQIAALSASDEEVASIRDIAAALRETNAAVADFRIAEKMAEEAKKLQDVKNLFSDALVDPLTDFVTGAKSAKDAFRDLCNDITRQLARLAAQSVANQLFGGNTSGGPDVFGVLGKIIGAWMGGGSLTGSPIPGSGMQPFATGGVSRGGLSLVGEMGPELVDLPAGARIYSNQESKRMGGMTLVQNFTVPARADTQTIRHQAKAGYRAAAGAARRG